MKAHECFHCKQWIPAGAEHDCWTTTEAALTKDLSEDLREAWERLRETALEFGEQRIYASHRSIMFSRGLRPGGSTRAPCQKKRKEETLTDPEAKPK